MFAECLNENASVIFELRFLKYENVIYAGWNFFKLLLSVLVMLGPFKVKGEVLAIAAILCSIGVAGLFASLANLKKPCK